METITFGTPMGSRRMPAVASAVPPDPPAEMMPPRSRRVAMKRSKALRHLHHRGTAIAGEHGLRAAGVMARHLRRAHAGRGRLARGGQVDRDRAHTQTLEAVADEEQLAALGVEGARDIRRARRPWPRPVRALAPRLLRVAPRGLLGCARGSTVASSGRITLSCVSLSGSPAFHWVKSAHGARGQAHGGSASSADRSASPARLTV